MSDRQAADPRETDPAEAPLNAETLDHVLNNIFPYARGAVSAWPASRWHSDSNGKCDTWKAHSSQALAIDVFGSLAQSSPAERDAIFAALAARLDIPPEGPWTLELEWIDSTFLLGEHRPTQVDAIARGRRSLILFECKFTESDGGRCSQLNVRKGTNTRQCDGNYKRQVNPTNGVEARCALSGKGIKYWDVIPTVFTYRQDTDYERCPFAGPWFQWMRNITLCCRLAQEEHRTPAFVIVYADSQFLSFPRKLQSKHWKRFLATLKPDSMKVDTLSYQALVRLALATAKNDTILSDRWTALDHWISTKFEAAAARVSGRSLPS